MNEFFYTLCQDGFFAAIAAIGFGSISNIPPKAFSACALLAAFGHMTRFALIQGAGVHLISASFVAALGIGFLSIPFATYWRCPAEYLSSPALLPMIPGMYAYRAVQYLLKCVEACTEAEYQHYHYIQTYNAMVCILIILLMVIGVTLPIFLFKNRSFKVTKVL